MVKYDDFKKLEVLLFRRTLTQSEWNLYALDNPGVLFMMINICDDRVFKKHNKYERYYPAEMIAKLRPDLWGKTDPRNKKSDKMKNIMDWEPVVEEDDWDDIRKRMDTLVSKNKKKEIEVESIMIHERKSIWD